MTEITSTKLGFLAMWIATVSLSLAQTPRIGTKGSNQTSITSRVSAGNIGLNGNSTSNRQLGPNPLPGISTGPNTNVGAHTAAAAANPVSARTILPQPAPVPIRGPSPTISPVGPNFSTPMESPSPSVTPTPTPTAPPL